MVKTTRFDKDHNQGLEFHISVYEVKKVLKTTNTISIIWLFSLHRGWHIGYVITKSERIIIFLKVLLHICKTSCQ